MGTPVKFNVIIPTRERADVLRHSLRTVVAQDYENLNIIVSDNFSQDNTRDVVATFNDPRIKYINPGRRLSMSHHWEFALGAVTDGWVMIVGDDDGLLPGALSKIAQVISDTGCLAVMSSLCRYDWPDTVVSDDHLRIPLSRGIAWRDSRVWLGKVMRAEANYFDLPCLYTGGTVEYSVINRARDPNGIFYFSWTPDIYSTFAIASVLDRYVMLKDPVAIAGRSSHSNGSSGWGYIKNQEPAKKFLSEGNIPFHSRLIPKNWPQDWPKSFEIAMYECYLQSAHLHHDFLKVKMEDQLGLALSQSPQEGYDVFRKYCVDIAGRNQVDMSAVDSKEKAYRRWGFFKRCKEKISYFFKYLALSGKEFGIHDVYEASILAKAAFLFETRYSQWRFKKFFQAVKKSFGLAGHK